MRVMVMVKATPSSEAGTLPSEKLMTDMGNFNEELVKAGIMKAGEGLKPTSAGVRVRFSGASRTVVDGPFAETKEVVAGYWLWEVASMQEAIEWVKKCPNPMEEDSDIEIRPLYEIEDLAEADPDGVVTAQEEVLRDRLAGQSAQGSPYLFFGGRCAEALEFYQQAIGARVGMVMRFNESPDPTPPGMVPPGHENKIMHCEFSVGALNLMASDGCGEPARFAGFRLALTLPTVEDARRVFAALAEGGTVDTPQGPTFWSPCFGMVTDRFQLGWMVMAAPPATEAQP